MSAVAVRAALETALATVGTNFPTVHENEKFTPVVDVAYQQVAVLFTQPANDEMSSSYREEGFLQVDLKYPLNAGSGAADTRAQAIRSAFPRGASFTASGVTVNISRTPEIMPGRNEPDRFVIPVRIQFHARIEGA